MSRQSHLWTPTRTLPVDDAVPGPDDAPVSPAPAAVLSSVTVTFGRGAAKVVALDEVTLRVAHGETLALLGPAGAGKSTVLRAMAGTVPLDRGQILLGDREVSGAPVQRGLSVIDGHLPAPYSRVADNVAVGLRARRRRRTEVHAAVDAALRAVGMSEYATALPVELTAKQRRKVCVARALTLDPAVLLLDSTGPSDDSTPEIDEIDWLRSQFPGRAMVFATDVASTALAIADRVAVLRAGRIVESGTPQALWDQPPSAFVARLLGGANLIEATMGRVYGASAMVSVGDRMFSALHHRALGGSIATSGSATLLCIRPHDVHVCAATTAGASVARVYSATWFGASTRLRLTVDGVSEQIVADVAGRVRYPVGSVVGVQLPAQSCVLVPADPHSTDKQW